MTDIRFGIGHELEYFAKFGAMEMCRIHMVWWILKSLLHDADNQWVYNIIVFFEQNMSLNSTHLIMKNCTAYNDWRDFLWQFVMYCEKIKANVYSMVQPSGKEFVFSCNGCLIFRKHFFFSKNLYVENLNNYFFTFLEH